MPDQSTTPQPDPPPSPLSANMPHRPADDSEEVYYEGSPLIRGAIGKAFWLEFLGLVLIAVPLVLRLVFKLHPPATYMAIPAFLGFLLVCIPPIRAKTIRYRVTNYRIDYERGLLSKDIDTLELWHVEDIQFHQNYLDRLLAMGTITVISHDISTPTLVMHSLPHSRHLFDQLKQRIISVKRQRGVLKVDTGS